jgi:hypothetical protein
MCDAGNNFTICQHRTAAAYNDSVIPIRYAMAQKNQYITDAKGITRSAQINFNQGL